MSSKVYVSAGHTSGGVLLCVQCTCQGHCTGLDHPAGPSQVMYMPSASASPQPSPDDRSGYSIIPQDLIRSLLCKNRGSLALGVNFIDLSQLELSGTIFCAGLKFSREGFTIFALTFKTFRGMCLPLPSPAQGPLSV